MPKMFLVIVSASLLLCNMLVAQSTEVVSAMDQEILTLTGGINELANKRLSRIRNADQALERCESALRNIIANPGAKASEIIRRKTAYINASLSAQRERQEIREKLEYVIYKYKERKQSLEMVGYTVDDSDFEGWKGKVLWYAYCRSYMTLLEIADKAIDQAERREIDRLQRELDQANKEKNRQRA